MITPLQLQLTNFMSHENSSFLFKNGKATMIEGKNNSDKGQVSNGSGKSAVIEGITVGLLGSALRDVSVKDLVRRGTKSAEVVLKLKNNKNNQHITLTRTIFSNTKSSTLTIEVDGQEITDLVSVRDKDNWILQIIDISKNDLLNYFLISKEKYTSFFNMSDSAKKEVIGRFSQSNLIDPTYDLVEEKVDEKQKEIDEKQKEIDTESGRQQVYQESLDELEDDNKVDPEKDKQNRISAIEVNVQNKKTTKLTHENDKKVVDNDINKDQQLLTDNPVIDNTDEISKLNKKKLANKVSRSEFREEEKETNQLKVDIEKALAGVVECPKCSHEFSLTDDSFDIEESRKVQLELQDLEKEIEKDIQALDDDDESIDSKIDLLEDAERVRKALRKTIQDRIDINDRKSKRLKRQMDDIDNDIESYNKSIERIEAEVVVDDEKTKEELRQKIQECKDNIAKFGEEKEELSLQLFQQKEWDGIFTKFKTHLANKSISVIQTYCNEWLQRMKSGLTIKLEGYKINRNGSIREKITCQVLRDGIDQGSLAMFSSGEKARIEIAIILALQKLINTNSSGGLDLCFLDEVIESVDSVGILSIMNTLNTLNQTIIVVTHGTLDQHYPNKYTVIKEKGKSTIHE